jgi:hypothetical protein
MFPEPPVESLRDLPALKATACAVMAAEAFPGALADANTRRDRC